MIEALKKRFLQKKQKFNDYEEDLKIQKLVGQKQKHSNERELERYYEERRQEMIKNKLAKIRKAKTREILTKNVYEKKGLYNNKANVLTNDKKTFSHKNKLFSKGNLLGGKKA